MKKCVLLVVVSCSFLIASFAQSWSTAGNNGTDPSINFLGTKDNQSLVIKTNSKERMRILSGGKIGIGTTKPLQLLDVNGSINISSGSSFYVDNHKLISADPANLNIFLGTGSGTLSITGFGNASAGNNALYSITTGSYNTAVGMAALFSSATASNNTAVGHTALFNNTTGNYNTATGKEALYKNNTGYSNTASGTYSLYSNTDGSYNTAVGWNALNNITTSWRNTAIGVSAGSGYGNSDDNTFVGSDARATLNGVYNSTALGHAAYITAPNQVRIGNAVVTSIGGYVGWSNVSDGRVKKNVKGNVPGLAFINKLKPVTYNLDLDAAEKIMQTSITKDKDDKSLLHQSAETEMDARSAKQQIIYTGFIAQDVEKAAKELNYDFSGVDAAKNDKGLYGLRYAEFVMPLVKAVQELDENQRSKFTSQDQEIAELKKEIEQLKTIIKGNQQDASINVQHQTSDTKWLGSSLKQNVPNPFNHTTTINYTITQRFNSAKIIITDRSGKTLKTLNVSGSGKGSLHVDASTLASGAYQYSLIVDERLIDSKQMVLIK
ncbi:MAG TPA: tail fiber domain-containing protein [Parafilimonas sp.]|nr:tail fiber domain-containing protein [Parafilimonas sp.]